MNSRLEQFIRDHREEFDADEPAKKVWEKIQHPGGQGEAGAPESTPVIWLSARRWSVAAAVSLLIAGSVWYFSRPTSGHIAPLVSNTQGVNAAGQHEAAGQHDGSSPVARTESPATSESVVKKDSIKKKGLPEEPSQEDLYKEEMYHYARLVELKHRELKGIEKNEPLLYRQFSGDVNKLDSVYQGLKKQLPENPNREQLLEAMIQNLQLQMGLLNHQLDIIKQINHSKKAEYEKAYRIG
ncbi:MAG: hypothetical protein Q8927_17135 [Bacteroidota bacterium]|nr:hypothetical protein [Bacteroidota bacterium]MDP4217930.1 hypothetical protein [Bacteroidota bacterium]MDP4245808.1 hypothetical protein [Bacteroidota bacterium]MDP4252946.1 hypothetical protein [Bacteroidota bacterium]MDP4256973.1 hypothetical protein [Bacteroidota bacterium]